MLDFEKTDKIATNERALYSIVMLGLFQEFRAEIKEETCAKLANILESLICAIESIQKNEKMTQIES